MKKDLKYYMGLNWTYDFEQESSTNGHYFVVRVNELPGVCTDAETLEEGLISIKEAIEGSIRLYLENDEPIPEPI